VPADAVPWLTIDTATATAKQAGNTGGLCVTVVQADSAATSASALLVGMEEHTSVPV